MSTRAKASVSVRLRATKRVLVALTAVSAVALVAFTAWAWRVNTGAPAKPASVAFQTTLGVSSYVRRARLWPRLSEALRLLGDRLEKPGKERLTLAGTLRRQNDALAVPFRLVLELPRRMRLEELSATPRVSGFDGSKGWVLGATLSDADRDTIETLVFDAVEGFFLGQMQGFATRDLGSRFRLGDGKTPNYTGPFYDIYQVSDRIGFGTSVRVQPKLFYFNSDTLLLERVRYQIERNGRAVKVEVQIGGWQNSSGQQLYTSIIRLEDGAPRLTLAIISAVLGQRLNDGIFNSP